MSLSIETDEGMSDPSIPSPVQEELDHLSQIRTLLIENPEDAARSEDEVVRELIRLRDEHRDAKEEDKGSLQTQLTQTMAVLDQVRKARERERVDPDAPYFAHLQLSENKSNRDIFLGRATRLSHGLRIVDWRNAPISRLFYQYEEGDEYEEEMAGRVREGRVTVRRNVHIQDGELLQSAHPTAVGFEPVTTVGENFHGNRFGWQEDKARPFVLARLNVLVWAPINAIVPINICPISLPSSIPTSLH